MLSGAAGVVSSVALQCGRRSCRRSSWPWESLGASGLRDHGLAMTTELLGGNSLGGLSLGEAGPPLPGTATLLTPRQFLNVSARRCVPTPLEGEVGSRAWRGCAASGLPFSASQPRGLCRNAFWGGAGAAGEGEGLWEPSRRDVLGHTLAAPARLASCALPGVCIFRQPLSQGLLLAVGAFSHHPALTHQLLLAPTPPWCSSPEPRMSLL